MRKEFGFAPKGNRLKSSETSTLEHKQVRTDMKNFVMTLCLLGATAGLAACATEGKGYVDEAPYAQERTAGGEGAPAEQVFRTRQHK